MDFGRFSLFLGVLGRSPMVSLFQYTPTGHIRWLDLGLFRSVWEKMGKDHRLLAACSLGPSGCVIIL